MSLFTFGLAQVTLVQAQVATPNDSLFPFQWSHKNNGNVPVFNGPGTCGTVGFDLNILPAWTRLDSRKNPPEIIRVGVLDTGLDPNHPDMDAGRVLPGINFTAGSYTATSGITTDTYGHGTHVTGAIAAKVNNGKGIAGIDRTCKVMPIVIQPACLIGERKHIADAIRYAANNNIKVINMSWGWQEVTIDPNIRDAISYAIGQGCVFVGAAGNDNDTVIDFPAKAGIAVGAANPCGFKKSGIPSCEFDTRPEWPQMHWGSNDGIGLDVMGPGTMLPAIDIKGPAGLSANSCTPIVSAGCYHADVTGTYITDAYGTSIATPYISGIVAQMLSVNPTLKMHEVEYLLKLSSKSMQGGLYRWPDADNAIVKAQKFLAGSRPLPDLAVTSVQFELIAANTIRATVVVLNRSLSVASAGSAVHAYLSRNSQIDTYDNFGGGDILSIPAIAPGASYTCSIVFQDFGSLVGDTFRKVWLNAIVDPDMVLEETDDANNARSVEVQLNQPAAFDREARMHQGEPNAVLPAKSALQLELFPNPANDYVTIAVELQGQGEVRLTDLLGKSLYVHVLTEAGKQHLRFDAAGLSPGVYMVELSQASGRSLTKKLVIR